MVICLELGADLHMAQLMPLPLTVFCFSKMQIGFLPFWYQFTRVVLEKGPLNGCVYVCHVWCKLYLCICRCIIIMEICGVFFICAVLRTKTLSITMQVLSTSCSVLSLFLIVTVLQCFDTVGWVSGRASGL